MAGYSAPTGNDEALTNYNKGQPTSSLYLQQSIDASDQTQQRETVLLYRDNPLSIDLYTPESRN